MWVGTAGGLSSFSNGRWSNFTAEDGLPWDDVISLHEDGEGVLWIGTTSGLAYMASGDIHSVRDADPALREPVLGLTDDDGETLWIATSNHILRINRSDLLKGHLAQGSIREYGLDDGLLQVGGVRRDRSVVNDGHGRIWFSTGRGLSVVDWRKQRIDSPPAIAHIDGISSDGNSVPLTSATTIAASPRRVVIDYAGLNLSAPDRVRFQYKLEGFDRNWTEATAARQAIYTNLPPGPYRFAVKASNDDDLWNGPEAALDFRIAPAFWQTLWFQLLCVLLATSLALLFYRARMREVAKRLNARFNDRLTERTRIAHELHDTLLQGLLSASMQLHMAAENVPEDSIAKPQLNHILELMGRVSEEGRNTLRCLRSSLDDARTLESALSSIPRELSIPEETAYRVVVDGLARPLHPAIRDEAYFIGREALVNAVRHAKASSIEVELEYTAMNLFMVVRDNGCGIDPDVLESGKEGHWGLPGMRERAEGIGAQLRLFSRSGAGTEVELAVPGKIAYERQSRSTWSSWLISMFPASFRIQKHKKQVN
jgi:signal transduction histidine kinase